MRPTTRLLGLLVLWVLLGLVASLWPAALPAWASYGVVVLALAAADLVALRRTRPPRMVRSVPPALALGVWLEVGLRLESDDARARSVALFDGVPATFELEGLPGVVRLPGRGWAELVYRVRPGARGAVSFGPAELVLGGPLGLLGRRVLAGEETSVRVFPNFRKVSQLAMLSVSARTARMGIHLRRRRGEGTEFFQLRDYRQGDALRQVDWKAVSRRRQLISRDYREEQNQQVLFLLDCGRRMRARDGDLCHFDHVLNAVLMLAYVALRQGDAVGVMTFSGPDRWLPPVKGRAAMGSILDAVYDLETTTAPSDYAEAAHRVAIRQRRRALVVLVTNLRDDDLSDLSAALAPLRRRHLLLVASLREPVLDLARGAAVVDFDSALRVASVHHYLRARQRAHELARGRGVRLLDVEPSALPVALVNRYLDIKGEGAL